ncbi:MAG TPA: hypothetical protein K8W03_05310 [Bifidobacterium pseudolongum subsp. globosum]|nr:hypothetical protein [Bifidobacterium pseudolongum subsp. globosum]
MSNKVQRALHAVKNSVHPYHLETYHALTPVCFQQDGTSANRRLNLFIPNIERSRMYGGQKTAYRFFEALLNQCGGDARILVERRYTPQELAVIEQQ